jgi:WD40 repeat protein
MYIRDLRNTEYVFPLRRLVGRVAADLGPPLVRPRHRSGHVAAVTAVAWHPKDSSLFLTASADSSLRIWELDNRRKSKSVIVVRSKERGGKTKVTACAWSPDGRSIAAGEPSV